MTLLKQIFSELSDLPKGPRTVQLAARCAGDARLAATVRSLLDADDVGQHHTAGPTLEFAPHEAGGARRQIGPYKILEQIGEGGFALVYLAEQETPVRRRVALKVLKPGMDAAPVVARFEAERHALAMMNHPHVAKVFDAGLTDVGQPYFVMEYVPGESITAFCDRHQFTTRQRLELFCQACAAVQHAHQKAIIHRDLKPTNILVTMEDGAPQVKVIDFGVAKALSQPLTDRTLFTGTGQLIGTPEYMSPEQAELGGADVDTRSDVYSLGVVLYELLCGALPFDSTMLRRAGYDEIRRIARDVEPPRPSAKLRGGTGLAMTAAHDRGTPVGALERELRGELEWIPLKAMRKEPDRRYASALQLADDIRNFLEKRPLLAAPESKAYRLRKFARRNRGPIAAAGALVLALVLGIIATSAMYVRAERQRAETQRQKDLAQARFDDVRKLANTFLFDLHGQIANLAGSTPARAALVQTALEYLQKLSAQAADDPGLLAEIYTAYVHVGDVQGNPYVANLGDTRGALDSYRTALEIARKLSAADPASAVQRRRVALGHERVGDILISANDAAAARDSYREALRIRQALADAEPGNPKVQRDLAVSHSRIGDVLAADGDARGAMEHYRAWVTIARKLVDADGASAMAQRDLSVGHDRIGDMLALGGDTGAALEAYRTALRIREALADADPANATTQRDLAASHERIGDMLAERGDRAAALASYRTSQNVRQKLADADPANANAQRDLAVSHSRIGAMQAVDGDSSAALASHQKELAIFRKLADADPANAAAQRSLSASRERVSRLLTARATAATAAR